MTTINVDQIVSVTVVEKPISTYEWICKSTFLGITFVKEGVYNSIFKNYLGTEIPKGYRLINGDIYGDPQVTLQFSNGEIRKVQFNTIEEANEFASKIYIAKPLRLK